MGGILLMVTIRFSESEQKDFNKMSHIFFRIVADFAMKELGKEYGFIIEDGKVVGIEKEM